jgi:serine kinase of HPr protein (carbohydrate metabolism regulator)
MIVHAGLIARRVAGLWKGVLIEGPSGSGKSGLALRALQHGFRLVADDRVLLWRSAGRLYGRAPDPLHGLIEMRGLDVVPATALAFAEVALVARLGTPDRIPQPEVETRLQKVIPALEIAANDLESPLKLARALEAFDVGSNRRM